MTAKILTHGVREACGLLGVSKATLFRLLRDRQLKRVKIRGRTVVRASDLERFLDRNTR